MKNGTTTWRYTYDANGMRTRRGGNNVPHGYEYIYNGGSLSQVIIDGWQTLKFTYDANGIPMTVTYDYEEYYYVTNQQGDVVGIVDSTGALVVSYTYDAWGKPLSITGSMADTLGVQNPLRYRSYVYDQETGLYYLQSRYYDPEIGRFINADNQLSASDMTSMNLFAYCGNNPVSRIDPTGEAWWHWALGAVVVAACAVATVVTCGGFAAAATAVCMVGSGVAAATTASTVAAAAFIGSATVYGTAVLAAASRSSSVEEFNAQGNWGTVAVTAGGALAGGYSGYAMSKTPQTTTTDTYTSRGSTGRTEPQNLKEKLAMEQVQASPLDGAMQLPIQMTDPRWPATEGWVKMASNVNGVEIHFVYNTIIQIFDDFKFKG